MADIFSTMHAEIESELKRQVSRLDEEHSLPFKDMLSYHMGWTGEGAGEETIGKRIRPLLLMLTTASCGGDWAKALPAAAAVELVHNFSLVHDDIQDNSPKRRGRPTVWVKWGSPMAINAGDALFVMSNLALTDLGDDIPARASIADCPNPPKDMSGSDPRSISRHVLREEKRCQG